MYDAKKRRQRYLKNREREKAQRHDRYRKNRQKERDQQKEYYEKHKDEIIERVTKNRRTSK